MITTLQGGRGNSIVPRAESRQWGGGMVEIKVREVLPEVTWLFNDAGLPKTLFYNMAELYWGEIALGIKLVTLPVVVMFLM